MSKEHTLLGEFYLKNGNIVKEELTLSSSTPKEEEDICKILDSLRDTIKYGLKNDTSFYIIFGNCIIRGSDTSAVRIVGKEDL